MAPFLHWFLCLNQKDECLLLVVSCNGGFVCWDIFLFLLLMLRNFPAISNSVNFLAIRMFMIPFIYFLLLSIMYNRQISSGITLVDNFGFWILIFDFSSSFWILLYLVFFNCLPFLLPSTTLANFPSEFFLPSIYITDYDDGCNL